MTRVAVRMLRLAGWQAVKFMLVRDGIVYVHREVWCPCPCGSCRKF